MPRVQVAGAVGCADRERYDGLQATDPRDGGPALPDRCGVRMHHPRIAKHTGSEHAGPPCGPACGRGLNWEASTHVDDPWIHEHWPILDSTRVEYQQLVPHMFSHLSFSSCFHFCMPHFSVTNWAQVLVRPANVTSTTANERRFALGHRAFCLLLR